jgi:hypothetical protein
VACPEKLIVCPTCQVSAELGVSITAVGAVLPTVMVTDARRSAQIDQYGSSA